jgi:hypothetical protein
MRINQTARAACVCLLLLGFAARGSGQTTLTVQGDHFAANGKGSFLVFVSYFDGVRRPPETLVEDFDWLVAHGVQGIRVFPQGVHWKPTGLMNSDGIVNAAIRDKLVKLVDVANQKGLFVDVSLDPALDGITNPLNFQQGSDGSGGVKKLAADLRDYPNVLFDLCNEWGPGKNCTPRFGDATHTRRVLSTIRDAIKAVHPQRIVVISSHGGDDNFPVFDVAKLRFDAATYHDPRGMDDPTWFDHTGDVVRSIRTKLQAAGAIAPVYLQEPHKYPDDSDVDHFATAVRQAKAAGAAAWTFHSDVHNRRDPSDASRTAFETQIPLRTLLQFDARLDETGGKDVVERFYNTGPGGTALQNVDWGVTTPPSPR